MIPSFLLAREKLDSVVEELHLNIWCIDEKTFIVDVGLLMQVPRHLLETSLGDLRLYVPFKIKKDTTCCLSEILHDHEAVELLFNDRVQGSDNLTPINNCSLVKFHEQRKNFVLTKVRFEEHDYLVVLKPQTQGISPLKLDELYKESASNQRKVYMRIRFEVDLKEEPYKYIYINNEFMKRKVMYDLRFMERRALKVMTEDEKEDISFMTAPVNNIFVFIIQPEKYHIKIGENSKMRYVRVLEQGFAGWESYIQGLDKRHKYLVYSWKDVRGEKPEEKTKEDKSKPLSSFTLLAVFETERNIVQRAIVLAAFMIVLLVSHFSLQLTGTNVTGLFLNNVVPWVSSQVVALVSFLLSATIVIGLITNFIYDGGKFLLARFWKP